MEGVNRIASINPLDYNTEIAKENYAHLLAWDSHSDAQFLAALLKNKIKVRRAFKAFKLNGKTYKEGTLIIVTSDNKNKGNLTDTLKSLAKKHKQLLEQKQALWTKEDLGELCSLSTQQKLVF